MGTGATGLRTHHAGVQTTFSTPGTFDLQVLPLLLPPSQVESQGARLKASSGVSAKRKEMPQEITAAHLVPIKHETLGFAILERWEDRVSLSLVTVAAYVCG